MPLSFDNRSFNIAKYKAHLQVGLRSLFL